MNKASIRYVCAVSFCLVHFPFKYLPVLIILLRQQIHIIIGIIMNLSFCLTKSALYHSRCM